MNRGNVHAPDSEDSQTLLPLLPRGQHHQGEQNHNNRGCWYVQVWSWILGLLDGICDAFRQLFWFKVDGKEVACRRDRLRVLVLLYVLEIMSFGLRSFQFHHGDHADELALHTSEGIWCGMLLLFAGVTLFRFDGVRTAVRGFEAEYERMDGAMMLTFVPFVALFILDMSVIVIDKWNALQLLLDLILYFTFFILWMSLRECSAETPYRRLHQLALVCHGLFATLVLAISSEHVWDLEREEGHSEAEVILERLKHSAEGIFVFEFLHLILHILKAFRGEEEHTQVNIANTNCWAPNPERVEYVASLALVIFYPVELLTIYLCGLQFGDELNFDYQSSSTVFDLGVFRVCVISALLLLLIVQWQKPTAGAGVAGSVVDGDIRCNPCKVLRSNFSRLVQKCFKDNYQKPLMWLAFSALVALDCLVAGFRREENLTIQIVLDFFGYLLLITLWSHDLPFHVAVIVQFVHWLFLFELLVVKIGGELKNFVPNTPGPDGHMAHHEFDKIDLCIYMQTIAEELLLFEIVHLSRNRVQVIAENRARRLQMGQQELAVGEHRGHNCNKVQEAH